MRRRTLGVAAALIGVVACAPDVPPIQEAPPERGEPARGAEAAVLEDLSCEGLAWTLLRVEPTRAELAAEFGVPDSVVATTEPNRHVEGQIDSLFAVHYAGLVSILRKPQGGRDMVDHAVVTANRFLAHPQIGIGAPQSQVLEALGDPTRRTPELLVYECGEGAEEPVTFHLDDGIVRRIEIEFYLD